MAKIKKIQESGATIYPATITNAVKDPETGKTIPEILKEREEDTYPKMTVGFAENVVGDGSATEEEFSFRPTAGVNRNTLNDGAARIHSIKGRSVVANQIASPRVTPETTKSGITYSIAADGTIRVIGTASSRVNINPFTARQDISHKYMMKGAPNGSEDTFYLTDQNVKEYGDGIIYTPYEGGETWWFVFYVMGGVSVDLTFKPILIDLTQEFGAGNEPTTVAEYYQRKPIGINEDEYKEGKLVNLVPQAIKTTGLNQFNGTYAKVLGGVKYYLGGNYTSIGFATEEDGTIEAITVPTSSEVVGGSAPTDRLYTPTQNGYIYANGDSICISLYWPTEYGNLYGAYQAYKPFERDLGDIIAKYFTDGVMRSAGSAHDEIRFNSTEQRWEAVHRVDVRPYAAGDESNSAVTTDGTNTNYALATPDVKVMDRIPNFDYDVSDYGTEELIVADGVESAPLSASIEYSPNVLATIKQTPDILDSIDKIEEVELPKKQDTLNLTVLNNGNIRISNLSGGSKDFMPATPSGDPMHYAYVDAGAVWNNTTGYWELNGLTDITTAQMRTIYNETAWIKTLSIQAGCLSHSKSRTNIVANYPDTLNSTTRIALNNAFRACKAEKIVLWDDTTNQIPVLYAGNLNAAFYGCAQLKSIYGTFDLSFQQYPSDLNNIFHNSTKLERVKLKGCKFNINLSTLSAFSVESATYLIANASTTEAFTVTFNANRQGIYEADSAFIEAKNAHPNVTINYL